MLEQRDFDMIKNMMEAVVGKSEASILSQVDEKLAKQEKSVLRQVDKKILKSESLLLDEIERTRGILEKQIGKIQQNVDELNTYYRINKLENQSITMIIEQLEDLTKRVEALERRTA